MRSFLLLAVLFLLAPAADAQHAEHFTAQTKNLGALVLKGYFVQGGVVMGRSNKLKAMSLEESEVPLGAKGEFVFGFARDEKSALVLTVVYKDGKFESHTLDVAKRRYDIQRIDGLPSKQVTPPPEVFARIKRDNAKIGEARRALGDWQDFASVWIWPARGRISGVYGSQRILNGKPRRPHFGVDIAAATGTPVVAPAGGLVRLAEADLYFSGGTIIIDHGQGLQSTFLHMDSVEVAPRQRVLQGERIGSIGATGRVTGAHLDWRVNWFARKLDAQFLLPRAIVATPQ